MTEENTTEIILVPENIITAAQEYTKQMSMPPEATASVLRTIQAAHALRAMVDSQHALEPATKRRLIASKAGITDQLLASIDAYCLANIFPYSFISVIEGQIYPMAQGLNLKLLADPRIFRGWEIVSKEILVIPDKNYICRIKAKGIFANGETYEATGVADSVQLLQRNKATTPALVELKAETRAKRRAAINALPLMGMIIEDSSDVEGEKSEQEGQVF
jgi:hypothetical protein